MKVNKEFSPITIKIETEEEQRLLRRVFTEYLNLRKKYDYVKFVRGDYLSEEEKLAATLAVSLDTNDKRI